MDSSRARDLLKRALVALFLGALFTGCQAKSALVRPVLEEEGELLVYLQAVPQEAELLTFILEGISAVKVEGGPHPLSLSVAEIRRGSVPRQRFLASGVLPPGEYAGLTFTVRSASLRGEEGPASLVVPEGRVTVGFPFRIDRGKAFLLCLALDYKKAVGAGYRFSPAFSIFVPDRPPVSLLGYVANFDSNNVTVFDKKERSVIRVIATGRGPWGIALDPRSRRAYVALAEDDAVEVIDAEAGEIIHQVKLDTGDNPREPALVPDGSLLFTANYGSDTVSVIDTGSLIEVDRVPVGKGPRSVLMGREGKRAYVFNGRSNAVSVIDVPSRVVAATISTVAEPMRGVFNRNGDRLYVIHASSPYLTVIDPSSLAVRERVFVGAGVRAIKVDPHTDFVYVGREPDALEVLDPVSLFPVATIAVGGEISSMAIDGEENNLHLVLPERKVLSILNLISREPATAVDVGEGADWVTLMGER